MDSLRPEERQTTGKQDACGSLVLVTIDQDLIMYPHELDRLEVMVASNEQESVRGRIGTALRRNGSQRGPRGHNSQKNQMWDGRGHYL